MREGGGKVRVGFSIIARWGIEESGAHNRIGGNAKKTALGLKKLALEGGGKRSRFGRDGDSSRGRRKRGAGKKLSAMGASSSKGRLYPFGATDGERSALRFYLRVISA